MAAPRRGAPQVSWAQPGAVCLLLLLLMTHCGCGALDLAGAVSEGDELVGSPVKRSDSLRHIELLSRRSALDKNFLRFGRGNMDNFLRFGKADGDYFTRLLRRLPDNANFMRLGRANGQDSSNFIRFGRGGDETPDESREEREDQREPSSLERQARRNDGVKFMRFGRAKDNFMRFGRPAGGTGSTDGDGFMRFGRGPHSFWSFSRDETLDRPDVMSDSHDGAAEPLLTSSSSGVSDSSSRDRRSPGWSGVPLPSHGTWRERRSSSPLLLHSSSSSSHPIPPPH